MLKIKSALRLTLCLGSVLFAAVLSQAAQADAAFSFGGYVNAGAPASVNLAALQSYAATNGTTTVTVNGDTYSGVSLYGFVDSYITPGANKNDILSFYAGGTGSNGSSIAYALGDLSGSGFGKQNDIIAFSDTNKTLTGPSIIAADGANVANLVSLDIGHQPYALGGGGNSTSLTISGVGLTDANITSVANFASLPQQQTINLSVPQINGGATTSFTGVSLWDLLLQQGLAINSPNLLNEYVVATGTDGYKAIFSLEEIDPAYGNENDLIAYQTNGGSLGTTGEFRIVVPEDGKAGRYVSNLDSLTLYSAVPEPASALLLLSGLFIPGFIGKRKPPVTID